MLRKGGTSILSFTLAICMAVCVIFLIEQMSLQPSQNVSELVTNKNRMMASYDGGSHAARPRVMSPSMRRKLAILRARHASGRMQQLADAPAEDDDTEYITFENDYKLGGGDLMVPVSMIDYENLGEGSIVDQRYPRRLPGQSQLLAELGEVFNIDGNWTWLDGWWGGDWLRQHGEAGVFVHDPSHAKLRRLGVRTG
mmetsp:Transcript_54828/g.114669  ORF Transcript_54828/g.114669 Transcript_54828/m.114669 type:complete len:197 (-) Transcript_54828:117-707(-)